MMNLFEVAQEIASRLARIFLRGKDGRRPVFGAVDKFQEDPNWRDNLLFYEYFHGDNGAGIGASHQTGWTGLIAKEIDIFRTVNAKDLLTGGRAAAYGAKSEEPGPTLSYVATSSPKAATGKSAEQVASKRG